MSDIPKPPKPPLSIGDGIDTIGQALAMFFVLWFLVQIGGCIERADSRHANHLAGAP